MTTYPRPEARRTARVALALAALASACAPPPPPSPEAQASPSWFEECAEESGVSFVWTSGHATRYWMPEIMGGGGALLDADEDGDLDLYLVQGGSLDEPGQGPGNRLLRNLGTGRFEDVSEQSGADDRGYGMGVACGDADGDGDTDLYVTNVGANVLLANDGTGRFRDVTATAGVGHGGWGTSAGFLDVDRDGLLDLYVCNYLEWSQTNEIPCSNALGKPDYCSPKTYRTPARDVLYRGLGTGRFADVSETSGVASARANGLGLVAADFDDDGWIDVFVANDGNGDFLWHNEGGERLREVGKLSGCAVDHDGLLKAGMGTAAADLDGDLDLDLIVGNLANESDSLFLNDGGRFHDRSARAGLGVASKPFTRFGLGWVDFDHDGLVDLYQANGRVSLVAELHAADPYAEPNLLFHGIAPARFQEVEPRGGVREPLVATSRAALFGDIDGNGSIDVVVVNRDGPAHVLRNRAAGNAQAPANWLLLRVREASGAEALGAVVTLRLGQTLRRADVRAASGYLASQDPRVHFGLGASEACDDVEVRWVDGEREAFGALPAGRCHELRRGAGTPLGR